ncbi:MAG: hypothetical protein LC777_21935, partial [Actinobacteria bacterium]|nr:hypothetical protein [Actinomycetota bacterium]
LSLDNTHSSSLEDEADKVSDTGGCCTFRSQIPAQHWTARVRNCAANHRACMRVTLSNFHVRNAIDQAQAGRDGALPRLGQAESGE